jgi:hypothetical protein
MNLFYIWYNCLNGRFLPTLDNSKSENIHDTNVNRTHDTNVREMEDIPCLRLYGHRDRSVVIMNEDLVVPVLKHHNMKAYGGMEI